MLDLINCYRSVFGLQHTQPGEAASISRQDEETDLVDQRKCEYDV